MSATDCVRACEKSPGHTGACVRSNPPMDPTTGRPKCPSWCDAHLTEVVDEGTDRSETIEVHRHVVTVGEVTVTIEDSPAWRTDPLHLPILTDEITAVDAAGARDYAAGLLEVARVVEGDQR